MNYNNKYAIMKTFGTVLASATVAAAAPLTVEADPKPMVGAIDEFAYGLINGFVAQQKLTEVSKCMADIEAEIPNVKAAILDLEAGHTAKAILKLKAIAADAPKIAADCNGTPDDIAALKAWEANFDTESKLIALLTKNVGANKAAIKTYSCRTDSTQTSFARA